jgi:hypothetical protein
VGGGGCAGIRIGAWTLDGIGGLTGCIAFIGCRTGFCVDPGSRFPFSEPVSVDWARSIVPADGMFVWDNP